MGWRVKKNNAPKDKTANENIVSGERKFIVPSINSGLLVSYDAFLKNTQLIIDSITDSIAVIKNDTVLFYLSPIENPLDTLINPETKKKKLLRTFDELLLEFYAMKEKDWSPRHAKEKYRRYHQSLKHCFNHKQINDISVTDIVDFLKPFQERGVVDLAHRLLTDISMVYDYAIILELIELNPCSKIKKILLSRSPKNFPMIDAKGLPALLKAIDHHENDRSEIVKYALKFMSLTFVRSGELLNAEWKEIDLNNKVWIIPPEKMKMKKEHQVPLCSQAIDLLEQIREHSKNTVYVFPHFYHNRPLKNNRMIYALYAIGYKGRMTVHGFRSLASSILNAHNFNADAIEKQLAHEEENRVRRAYNRADYYQLRVTMMQWWGDYLEQLYPEYVQSKQIKMVYHND